MKINCVVVGELQTNCYILISNNECVVIDPGDKDEKIIKTISNNLLKYILLTHNHFDHTGGVSYLKKNFNVKCGIHIFDKTSDLFDFELNEGDKLYFGNETIEVIHTPGHTLGSCSFLITNFLFSGDTIFCFGYGRTDLPGGDESNLMNSINKLLKLSDEIKIYPGHGPSCKMKEFKKFHFMK